MSRACDHERGFTLLEALAAVAVTAAILAGLAALAGQWLPNWRHGFQALQNADLIGLALDRIVEDVASAEYARLDGGRGPPLFRGTPEAVTFVRQAIGPGAAPRLEIVRIGESQTQQGVEAEREHASLAPGAIGAFRDATTLLRPPFRLSFAYAGPDGQWRSAWSASAKLPRAVRLTVQAESGAVLASTAFALKVTAEPEIATQSQAVDAGNPLAARR
ncbi:MAG: prepilin-type N-terminal cleavage/methylation domain-containing protein [Roseiarcus sp.]|jgi:general secretion pathway protein J